MFSNAHRYDPWYHLQDRWPHAEVVIEPLHGTLLGEIRFPPLQIALTATSSAAQQRCTLAHEIVHLERGLADVGAWAWREERQVHSEAARRLITPEDLAAALRGVAGAPDLGTLAQLLDVDSETLNVRLALLEPRELASIRRWTSGELWSVA